VEAATMLKPAATEVEALNQAAELLKFAAEHAQVTESVVATITTARQAAQDDQWTPEISAKFWVAYNSLCAAIKPVTLDSISSNQPTTKRPKRFWQSTSPQSKRSGRIYLILLIISLLLSVYMQFVVSTATALATDTQNILAENDKTAAQISHDVAAIRTTLGSKDFSKDALTPDEQKAVAPIQDRFEQIWLNEEKIVIKLKLFALLTSLGLIDTTWNEATFKPDQSVQIFDESMLKYLNNKRFFSTILESGLLITKVMNSVLPLLLGFVGACAYVTRLISEQIKTSTFSNTSPIRHLVRVFLGALAGVIVGFGWFGSAPSASPFALAFIAGYAIEPVFATIDSISEKFRQQSA